MRILFTAALLAATATPALAQEAAPFTGPHIEALVGYDRLNSPEDVDDGKDGLLYGVGIGYDFQLGGLIAGIEGEVSDSTTKLRGADVDVTGDALRIDTDRDLYVGGRLGFAASPSTMVYAKGGYTNLRLESEYSLSGVSARTANTLDGYRIGAGVEQKFNLFGPSGFAKVEYRYSNYQNLDTEAGDVDIDLDRHQVVLGVGVRF